MICFVLFNIVEESTIGFLSGDGQAPEQHSNM